MTNEFEASKDTSSGESSTFSGESSTFFEKCSRRWELILFAVFVIVFIIVWWSVIYENDRDQVKSIEIKINGLEQVAADTSQSIQNTNSQTTNAAAEIKALMAQVGTLAETTGAVETDVGEVRRQLDETEQTDSLATATSGKIPYSLDDKNMQLQKLNGLISVDRKFVTLEDGVYGFTYPYEDSTKTTPLSEVPYYMIEMELVLRETTPEGKMVEYGNIPLPKMRAERLCNNLYENRELPMFQCEFRTSPVKTAGDIPLVRLGVSDKESVILLQYTSQTGESTLTGVNIQLLDEFRDVTNVVTDSHFRVVGLEAYDSNNAVVRAIPPTDVTWRTQKTKSSPAF